MTTYRPLMENWLYLCVAAYVVLACVLGTGCKAKRVVTVEQVDAMIKEHLHVGSSKAEVAAFIDSLNIDSLEISRDDRFYGSDHDGDLDPEKVASLGDRFSEFYDAAIEDIAPSTTTLMARIRMRFYFGQDGKLLDYTTKEDTGFR